MIQPPNISVLLFLVAASLLEQQGVPRMISKNHGYWSCTLLAASSWEKSCTRHQSIHINALTICKLQSHQHFATYFAPKSMRWNRQITAAELHDAEVCNYPPAVFAEVYDHKVFLKINYFAAAKLLQGVNLVFQTTNFFDGFYRVENINWLFVAGTPILLYDDDKVQKPEDQHQWNDIHCLVSVVYFWSSINQKPSNPKPLEQEIAILFQAANCTQLDMALSSRSVHRSVALTWIDL